MEAETVMRNVVLPHYLFGFIFFLFSAIFFIKAVSQKENSGRNYILAILFGNLLAFVHSAELIILYVSLVLFSILSNLRYLRSKNLDKLLYALPYFLKTIIFIIATSPFLFYFQKEFTKEPWKYAIKAWESQSGFYATITGFKEYALTLGPVFILGIIGIIFFIRKKFSIFPLRPRSEASNKLISNNNSQPVTRNSLTNQHYILFCLSWILAHFSLVYLSHPLLKIAPLRFLHNPILIPISIFAALFVINLSINSTSLPRAALGNLTRAALGRIIIPIVCFMVLAISTPVYLNTLKYHFQTYNDFSTLIYPSKEMVKSFDWLSQNTNPNDAVLTAYEAGSLIPFMSGNTVYTGHLWSTINYQEKSQKAGEFFSGQMPPELAYSFLRKGNIKLIYYGPQEKSAGGQIEKYPFLKEIYKNNEVRIYQII